MRHLHILAVTGSLFFLQSCLSSAFAENRYYFIEPAGEYTYLASPWVNIPGCSEGGYVCDFSISGAFGIDFDRTADTARFTYASLSLGGNESVQMDPPVIAPVTPERVGEWLGNSLFERIFALPDGEMYRHDFVSGLRLLDTLDGGLHLDGGYNSTFVDVNGMFFKFSATEFVPDVGDFDLDQQLDGEDFLRWQLDPAMPEDLGDLSDWLSDFGSPPSVFAVVPEPSTLLLTINVLAVVVLCATHRKF